MVPALRLSNPLPRLRLPRWHPHLGLRLRFTHPLGRVRAFAERPRTKGKRNRRMMVIVNRWCTVISGARGAVCRGVDGWDGGGGVEGGANEEFYGRKGITVKEIPKGGVPWPERGRDTKDGKKVWSEGVMGLVEALSAADQQGRRICDGDHDGSSRRVKGG
ncbi:hypothetical protein GE21DRAFT_7645 [Neurospora crassa]|uniref:Uncharacterized protein n=2 Tax=Neurospora crassa TaxID=5141 RepID=Q1K828_NEUCR|nr:hypothetical protein NCU01223 [Neurospora crassa OR74A]EAA32353.1 hypothetical protein NCU01223 [Neurospora crassa OR74A]KHE87787.1 hypothetical protein GE21DRAFT_7645 [Neurospora crassa]CAB88560.3 hypothetical protein [Neurospora crassa]|eukprot:XP_961589.1 hypothetical protein NCU01223 [Neurospora crassa OR74A]